MARSPYKTKIRLPGYPLQMQLVSLYKPSPADCSGKVNEEKSEDTLLQEDPPDYMNEVDSLGDAPFHSATETGLHSETDEFTFG
jgi:hypothetical protein